MPTTEPASTTDPGATKPMKTLTVSRAKVARDALVEVLDCGDLTDADREAIEAAIEIVADRLGIGDLDPTVG